MKGIWYKIVLKLFEYSKVFLNSKIYPIFIFLLALFSHTFSFEEACAGLLILSVIVGLFVCNDLKFLISPLFFFIFMFSEKSVASDRFFEKPYLIAMIVLGIIVLISFVMHFVLYRKNLNFKDFKSSKLTFGVIVLSIAFFFNGFLSSTEFHRENIIFPLALFLCLFVVFFIFQINLNKDINLKNYIFYVVFLLSLLLTSQVFLAFINQIQIVNGELIKESILFGWGMWNNMGGMLAFLLPAHFYFASTVKKYGFIFYFTGLISFVAILLTLSRSSLLTSSLIIVICIIASCFVGCNKLQNRILTISLIAIGVVLVIVLREKITTLLGDIISRGFDDNGRFKIYAYGLLNYTANPLFGRGFYSPYQFGHQFITFLPFRYHNSIIQMMTSCGTVGLVAYLWHRVDTIRLLFKNKSKYTLFIGLSILSLVLCSLLDNHLFNLYPTFIYTVLLVSVEKNSKAK